MATLTADRMSSWRRINPERLTPHQLAPHEIDVALDLLDDSARWLREQGIANQWPSSFRDPAPGDVIKDRPEALRRHAQIGQVWVLRDGGFHDQPVGTITVTHWPELDFAHYWPGGHDDLFDARYLCRMAVSRSVAGQGVGAMLVSYAQWLARNVGVSWLRLDCAKRNEKLHAYYKRLGFEHVTTVELHDRQTGALFQRPVAPTAARELSMETGAAIGN